MALVHMPGTPSSPPPRTLTLRPNIPPQPEIHLNMGCWFMTLFGLSSVCKSWGLFGSMHNELLRVIPPECHQRGGVAPWGGLWEGGLAREDWLWNGTGRDGTGSPRSSPHRAINASPLPVYKLYYNHANYRFGLCVCLIIACSRGIQLPPRMGNEIDFKDINWLLWVPKSEWIWIIVLCVIFMRHL